MSFDAMSDTVEKALAHPLAFFLFIAWCVFMPMVNIDAANYGISVITAMVLMLTLGSVRRDRKAVHVKLDDLEISVEEADSAKAGIEKLTEEEILAKAANTQ